jgi:hypothetical protein
MSEEIKTKPVTLKKAYLPEFYIEAKEPFFEGKGNHSVTKLEEICEGYKEYAHQADIAFYSCSRKADSLAEQKSDLLEALKKLHSMTLYKLSPEDNRDTHAPSELFEEIENIIKKSES